jgi:hypothetical protein
MVCVVWVYFYLPEVKGRTLEEIDAMVSNLILDNIEEVPNRNSCTVQREAPCKKI